MAHIDRSLPMQELTLAVRDLEDQSSSEAIARELLDLLEDPPYTSNKSRPLWSSVVAQLGDRHAVPASVAPLAVLAADYQKVFGPTRVGAWLEEELRALVTRLAERFPAAPRAPVAKTVQPAPAQGSIEDLLAQVGARADDDETRLVLADALMEKGDPRGDFIALQMRAHRGESLAKAEVTRERKLLKTHEKEWLGPVADLTNKPSRVWRRGFLEECSFLPRGKFLTRAVGHPAWATVRVLRMQSYDGAKGLDVILHPVLRGVRVLDGPPHPVLKAIATSEQPWAIEQLSGSLVDRNGLVPELLEARGLPSLREVRLRQWFGAYDSPEKLRSLWRSRLGEQLSLFRFGLYDNFWPQWVSEVLDAPMPVEVEMSALLRVDQDRLSVSPSERRGLQPDVVSLLAALPAGRFTTVDIDELLSSDEVDRAAARVRR
jgi:uncharacterized protein (TIGR02996 family)